MKTLSLLAVIVAVECGGNHVVGKDRCQAGSCAQNEVCDFDGTCRLFCGSNYPNVTCPSGTVCASYICRDACSNDTPSGACPAGSQCDVTQTATGVVNSCGPVVCRDVSVCQAGEACIGGYCQATNVPCGSDQTCPSQSQVCDQGTCRARCGANTATQCAAGTTCSTSGQQSLCL